MNPFKRLTLTYLRNNIKFLEYLGYCDTQGWVYSEYMGDGKYRILAVKDSVITILINFEGEKQDDES